MTKDWRETLFVWDGIISFAEKEDKENNENGDDPAAASVAVEDDEKEVKPPSTSAVDDKRGERLKWEGTWVGCDSSDASLVPTPRRGAFDEFVTSDHRFEVEGVVAAMEASADDGEKKEDGALIVGGTSSLRHVAMTDGPGYDLGEGGEKKRHKDDRHDVYFQSPTLRWTGNLHDQACNLVFALGENEHGRFVSVGWLRVGNRVTLARRYVEDDDERAGWDVDDLRRAVFDQIATTDGEGRMGLMIPPWQCAAMHADADKVKATKRQKIAKE